MRSLKKVKEGSMAKGDVLGTARIAGIMAAKKTFELIPMCHLLMLTKCKVDFEMLEETKEIKAVCLVKTIGKTGVEMYSYVRLSIDRCTATYVLSIDRCTAYVRLTFDRCTAT